MLSLNHESKGSPLSIKVAGRGSPLSQVQIQEVLDELRQFHPQVSFDIHYVVTQGDLDQVTSLRSLSLTNFFTKEIDELILNHHCRISIHSAKDLPDPLPSGLTLLCLTKGLVSFDVLVLRENESLHSLPLGACIATSSLRREESVRQLRKDFTFKDIRGTIEQRLSVLKNFEADGVVIAEAALIRLKLTTLNRIPLPGMTMPLQGQLAVVGRVDDLEMTRLFACLDTRSYKK